MMAELNTATPASPVVSQRPSPGASSGAPSGNARIQISRGVAAGGLLEVRLLVQHGMETGHRQDDVGKFIARNIIRNLRCLYNGVQVFDADLSSGISANPYFQFFLRATVSGELVVSWVDDDGVQGEARQRVELAA
jgi:sulfur-oxidizing protein SoxZ